MRSITQIFIITFLVVAFTSNASAALTKTLKSGDSGEQVSQLQVFLIISGFLPSGADTGVYDATTTQAVKAFQKSVKLPQVGNVGPATKLKINGALYKIFLQQKRK